MSKLNESAEHIGTYKERQISTRRTPMNVRQVGTVGEKLKIYIEDYVVSYIDKLEKEHKKKMGQAVLLGRYEKRNGSTSVFISGAVQMTEIFPEEGKAFSNEMWEVVHEKMKKYFPELEIVGWACLVEEARTDRVDKNISYVHKNQFSGGEKLLLLYNFLEKEINFYVKKQGEMCCQSGYYVYYEKNEAMKNYRLAQQPALSGEEQYEDRVLEGVRRKMERHEKERSRRSAYIVGGAGIAALTVALLLINVLQNNRARIHELEATIETMTDRLNREKKANQLLLQAEGGQTQAEDEAKSSKEQEDENAKESDGETDSKKDGTGEEADGSSVKDNAAKDGTDSQWKEDSLEETAGYNSGDDNKVQDAAKDENQADTEKSDGIDIEGSKKGTDGNETTKSGETSQQEDGEEVETASIIGYYTVKKGDTLSQISSKYYDTVTCTDLICEANEITDADSIFPGQVLILPGRH